MYKVKSVTDESGAVLPLDTAKATYKGLTWTEKGDGLATLRGVEDKAWEEKLPGYDQFRGKLGESAAALAACMAFDTEIERAAHRRGLRFARLSSAEPIDEMVQRTLRHIGLLG